MITAGLCTSSAMINIADEAETPYALIQLDDRITVNISPIEFDRMAQVAESTDSVMVYADFFEINGDEQNLHPLNDYLYGSVRDDFDFGPLVLINTSALRKASISLPDLEYAGWYATRLALSRIGKITHIPEPLYSASKPDATSQFDYVDPRNRTVQKEMELAFTHHLSKLGALLSPPFASFEPTSEFPVEASVIIPVKNRVKTVAKAIESALGQDTDFKFNIIVVDNHSTDGTTELLGELAANDNRIHHLIPNCKTLGIGGCWNLAINSDVCGRYSIQLDSDDLYSSPMTLQRIVDCFRQEKAAMVIGSYQLTDFNLNPIPPGVIDHSEWTDHNGPNNALRINGLGAPRAFCTELVRRHPFPNTSYGEDYAMALRLSRSYKLARIFDVLYLCRRWDGNSDAALSIEKANRFNHYKDSIRTWELSARTK